MKEVIWMKVSNDKYEFPVAVAGSVGELARILGVRKNAILSAISHANKKGFNCLYKKVIIEGESDG